MTENGTYQALFETFDSALMLLLLLLVQKLCKEMSQTIRSKGANLHLTSFAASRSTMTTVFEYYKHNLQEFNVATVDLAAFVLECASEFPWSAQ